MTRYTSEREFQGNLERALRSAGMIYEREVCKTYLGGLDRIFADFVVYPYTGPSWAIECKLTDDKSEGTKALGQCMSYLAHQMAKRAVIVTPHYKSMPFSVWRSARFAGIDVLTEDDVVSAISVNEPFEPLAPTFNEQWLQFQHYACKHDRRRCFDEETAVLDALKEGSSLRGLVSL